MHEDPPRPCGTWNLARTISTPLAEELAEKKRGAAEE
jgi:hypothetical protein